MPTLTLPQYFRWALNNLGLATAIADIATEYQSATTLEGKVEALIKFIRLGASIYESLLSVPREATAAEILETQLLDAMQDVPGTRGLFDRIKVGGALRIGFQLLKILGPMVAPESAGLFELLGKLEAIGS